MTEDKALNYENWYMGEVADIVGPEAMTDFIIMDPFGFLINADNQDEEESRYFNIEGFLNYKNMIIPLIVVSEENSDACNSESEMPDDICLYAQHYIALNGYIVVGKYIWDAYRKMSIKGKENFLNNFYPLIAQCIDNEYFSTRGDEFAVAHCGFKEYQKAMFSLEDIRCSYQHKRENKCEKTKKFGDRLLPLENIAQTCKSPDSKIYYYDFGYIYTRANPM